MTVISEVSIAEEVAAYRREHDLTLRQLADKVGVSLNTVWKAENDQLSADSPLYEKIVRTIHRGSQKAAKAEPEPEPVSEEALQAETEVEAETKGEAQDVEQDVGWTGVPAPPVTIWSAVYEETPQKASIHGRIDVQDLLKLGLDHDQYQRRALGRKVLTRFADDYKNNAVVPDLILAMRGTNYRFDEKGRTATLNGETWVVDGQQRSLGALWAALEGIRPWLGCRIFLDSDEVWECEQFLNYNNKRLNDSPNHMILLMAKKNAFLRMFCDLCADRDFALCGKVQFGKDMLIGEVISAIGLLKTFSRLFVRFAPGLTIQSKDTLAERLLMAMDEMGRDNMLNAMIAYWAVIDRAFGLRDIKKKGNYFAHQSFNIAHARVLGNAREFWQGKDHNRFHMPADRLNKLRSFDFNDPEIIRLCVSSIQGESSNQLSRAILNHYNKRAKSAANRLHSLRGEWPSF